MKKLLYTTTAFVLCGGIVQANAACIATPSCYDMGYSSTSSCDGGLKCPFGSYWYCPEEIIKGGECADFPYTCFGRGYVEAAGIGADCNGKYVKCECYEGFEWQDGKGCVDISSECEPGAILYDDNTCSASMYDHDMGLKTAIGIVVYTDGMGHGQAMAFKSLGSYDWQDPDPGTNIISLPDYKTAEEASKDFDSCGNTEKIISEGSKGTYPAAWAAHEYKTAGTEAGDWCLPAAGILTSIYNNLDAINVGLSRAGGNKVTEAWSSTEEYIHAGDIFCAWRIDFDNDYGLDWIYKYSSEPVRPVLEF